MSDLENDLYGDSSGNGNAAVSSAILGQESGNNPNSPMSVNGAIGQAQITPDTFAQYAKPGEDINNPDDNLAVHNRIIDDLSRKAGGDPARIAVGYFSGPGNIASPDSPTPWKADHKDGNGKSVSSYVSDVMGRLNPVTSAQASGSATPSDLESDLYGNDAQGKDLSNDPGLVDALQYSTDPARAAYQGTMNTVAKPINNAVSSVIGAATAPIAPVAHAVAGAIDSTGVGQWIGDKLMGAKDAVSSAVAPAIANIKDLESYNPDLEKDLSAFGENAQLAGNVAGFKPIGNALNGVGENAAAALARPADIFPEARAFTPADYNPIATHSAISDSYGAAKAATRPYYNLMTDIASGESADATDLKPALDSMIDDIQNTPFHEATPELSYLKQQAAKIGGNGTMPLNDMVKLKQNLNSNFNPKRFAQGADTPYAKVGNLVDDSLEDAAQRVPEFGEAKSLADKNWLNTVKAPFEDNTVLQKFWKPEDYYAKKSVDSGMLEELPDQTKYRADNMLGGVKTPVQLNAIRRVLPQNLSKVFSDAKINDVIQTEGAGRLASLGKAITGIPKIAISPLKGTGQVLINAGRTIVPDLTQKGKDLIAAAKMPSPSLSTKYQKPFSALKTSLQQQSDLADEMQPYGVPRPKPKPLLALPAPKTVNYVNPAGQNVPLTPAARDIIGQSPSTIAEQTSADAARVNDASAQAQSELLRQYGTKRLSDATSLPPPKYPASAPGTLGMLAMSKAQKLAEAQKVDEMSKIVPRTLQQDYEEATEPYIETEMARKLREAGFAKGGIVKNREIHLSKQLKAKLGRDPKAREIELATYVGPHGVHRLLKQKEAKMAAHKMFPEAVVRENRALFFNKRKPYTVEQIKAVL